MVSATIQTSGGHLNPSITIGFMVTRKIKPAAGIAYIITQLIAAVLASFAVYLISGGDPAAAAKILQGTPEFSGSAGLAVLAEIIATFFLAFVIWGSAADPRARNTGGFAIGMAVAADILAIGPITGASLNPSRSFGPTFVASLLQGGGSLWHHHWVYWVGPVVGSVLAATAYHVGLWPSDPKRGLDPAAVDVAKTLRPGAPEGA
jgi:MIP family channel proteins